MKRSTRYARTKTATLSADATTSRHGFTIVELLIVVVIIAILAAIALVAYNGITSRSKASAALAAVKQAYTKMQTYAVTNGEQYPPDLATAGITASGSTTYQYRYDNSSNPSSFCLTATTQNVSYYVSSTAGSPTVGACAGHGANGAATITNLVRNPTLSASGPADFSFSTAGSTGTNSQIAATGSGLPSGVSTMLRRATTSAPTGSPLIAAVSPVESDGFEVGANQTYTASAFMRSSCTLSAGFRLDITLNGSTPTSVTGSTDPNIGGTWRRVSTTFTTPSGTTSVVIRPSFSGPQGCAASSTYDVSALMLTSGGDLSIYGDGTSAGWAWTGPAFNSRSSGPAL
jgi:prepilin-type N-terminal cleavage/methylation domain-containing protein